MITALTDRLVFRCSQIFCSAISRSLRCFSVYSVHVQLLASHHTDLLHSNQDFALFNLLRFRAMFHASYFVEIWPKPLSFPNMVRWKTLLFVNRVVSITFRSCSQHTWYLFL